ncbi:XRE family transcriptional regulator [Brevibacillus humidisoli]|uniref:helix-turn-helix domain-containing protein n=1 Tax=Brevibacillus humidisoli TaxID=2895522 RepID=UPI001E4FC4F6|nr:XRE family transcriptional regulator [Brevibacillus humidisoli]UFJ40102.1 XRE family transcriptional regulator [Brevibacillus humidisoli]
MKNRKQFSSFVPERLKEGREARGLTLVELAEKIGVTHQAVSKYEKGKAVPAHNVLDRITYVLNLPLSFFLRPIEEKRDGIVYFRSIAAASVKSKKIHQTKINWLRDVHCYLESILDFPALDIPKVNTTSHFVETNFNDIDDIALEVRRRWGLGNGPITNLIRLLEKKGVIIARARLMNYKIDACSLWNEGERPYILLGNDEQSAVRSRFNLAHELGHLILHSSITLEEFKKKENYKRMEKEAHRFASAFLLPYNSFPQEIFSSSLDHFISLKKRWNVSIGAMIYRAEELGIISDYQALYLRKKMNALGMTKREPLDAETPLEEPIALKQAIELLLEHNVKGKSDLVSEIGLSAKEIEEVANFPDGYLTERETGPSAKIIHLRPR